MEMGKPNSPRTGLIFRFILCPHTAESESAGVDNSGRGFTNGRLNRSIALIILLPLLLTNSIRQANRATWKTAAKYCRFLFHSVGQHEILSMNQVLNSLASSTHP